MSATTPVIICPVTGEVGIRLDDVLLLVKAPYAGSGATVQTEVRWQASLTNSFPAVAPNLITGADTLLRENDDRQLGDDWHELWGALLALPPGTLVYISCMVRNDDGDPSAWATAVSVTIEAAPLTSADLVAAS